MSEKPKSAKKRFLVKKKKTAQVTQTERRLLTDEEKYARDKQRAERIRKKRAIRERTVAICALMAAVYVGVIGIIAVYGILSFNSAVQSDKVYSVEGYLGEERVFNVPAATANNSYGLYIPFSSLEKLCPISVAGDGESINLILPDSGDYIKCFSNSSSIWVNDSPCRLASPVLFNKNDWMIPVELLEHINGLKVTYGDNRVCTLYRESLEVPLSASHSLPIGIENIEFSPLYDTDYFHEESSEEPSEPPME